MNDNAVLSVSNLTVSFGDQSPVVKGISFDIKQGEVVGIVGESGSGKTVSCLSLMRLLSDKAVVAGSILLGNQNILSLEEREIRRYRGKEISMVFQEPMSAFNPSQRCGHQVREAILIHQDLNKAEAKDKVLSLFNDVALHDVERIYNSYPHELSGGQLQRVMIAMAISNFPKIIIADEPTTALDVTIQKNIIDLLKSIAVKHNTAIIFISHDLGVVRAIADRVIVMKSGEIVEQNSVQSLFEEPKHPYTKGLLACRPPLNQRIKRLPTVQDFLSSPNIDATSYQNSLVVTNDEFKANIDKLNAKNVVLSVSDLHMKYPVRKNWLGRTTHFLDVLKGVDFKVREGEVLGVVGESGSGKSTCGKAILRLINPTHGKVHFLGTDLKEVSNSDLRKMRKDFQIIFQDPYSSLNPRMKIGKAIMEPMQVHNIGSSYEERKSLALSLLEKVGLLQEHFDRYPHEFSGGQRQRICIARTLAMKPKFIVCDESVSALDVSVQAQILNLLLDLKEEYNLSLLFISHDISVVKFFCDHIIVLQDGQIVEHGNAEEIYHNPQHPYTKKLIESVYV